MPKRLSLGYDINRLFILIAVLEKVLEKPFFDRDIYIYVTGGMKVADPAIDLAVAGSILSSYNDMNIGKDTALFGEIGLTGEIRKVINMEARLKECERLGIKRVLCPRGAERIPGVETIPLKTIRDLHKQLVEKNDA